MDPWDFFGLGVSAGAGKTRDVLASSQSLEKDWSSRKILRPKIK